MPTEKLPYGDAFLVGTPALDRLSQQLYGEHIRKERYKEQQDKMLDDEFARNMSGIRDAGIGDLTKAYGDYKLSYQAGMKKQNISPQEQLEILKKKAQVYDVINKSKTEREREMTYGKSITSDRKGHFANDAQDKLRMRMGLPVSKLNGFDDNSLLYPYSVPELNKEIEAARGKVGKKDVLIGVDPKDPLKDVKETYDVRANPNDFQTRLLAQMVTSNKADNYERFKTNQYSDEELENLKNRYTAKINDPKFKAVYGEVRPLEGLDTKLGQATAIQTMEEYANLPLNAVTKSELNQDRARTRSEEFRKQMMEQQHKNALSRLYVYAGIQQGKEDKNELLAIRELKSYINQASTRNGEFTPRQEIINNLSTGTGILKQSPNKFVLSDDGTTVTYSGDGLEPRTVPVEAFFNDITNALPTKDKGSAAQKAIDDAKKKKVEQKPKGKYD